MINIIGALKNGRTIKAMIGLSASEFYQLTQSFEREIQDETWIRYEIGMKQGDRKRKPGGGRKGALSTFAKNYFSFSFILSVIQLLMS